MNWEYSYVINMLFTYWVTGILIYSQLFDRDWRSKERKPMSRNSHRTSDILCNAVSEVPQMNDCTRIRTILCRMLGLSIHVQYKIYICTYLHIIPITYLVYAVRRITNRPSLCGYKRNHYSFFIRYFLHIKNGLISKMWLIITSH